MIKFDKLDKCERCSQFEVEQVQESSIVSFFDAITCTDKDIYRNTIRCKHLKVCRAYEKRLKEKNDELKELKKFKEAAIRAHDSETEKANIDNSMAA